MAILGNNVVKLIVGQAFAKHPPLKATEGVLKCHIMMGTKNTISKKSGSMRDYFFGIAKLAENKDRAPIANFLKSYLA